VVSVNERQLKCAEFGKSHTTSSRRYISCSFQHPAQQIIVVGIDDRLFESHPSQVFLDSAYGGSGAGLRPSLTQARARARVDEPYSRFSALPQAVHRRKKRISGMARGARGRRKPWDQRIFSGVGLQA